MPVMRLRTMSVLALTGLLVCCGCQGGHKGGNLAVQPGGNSAATAGLTAVTPDSLAQAFDLPAPSTLSSPGNAEKQSAYLPEDLIHEAELINLTLPNNRVAATAGGATFTPAFTNGSPLIDAAYAT